MTNTVTSLTTPFAGLNSAEEPIMDAPVKVGTVDPLPTSVMWWVAPSTAPAAIE